MAVTQVLLTRDNTVNGISNAAEFVNPLDGGAAIAEADGSCVLWPTAGSFTQLTINLDVAPGGATSWTIAIRINGVDTGASFTISGSATSGSWTGTQTVNVGDQVSLHFVGNSSPTVAHTLIALTFVGTNVGESAYGFTRGISTANQNVWQGILAGSPAWLTTQANAVNVVPTGGTLTRLSLWANSAPGAGKTQTATLVKNGVVQDGSGSTVNTTVSITGASQTTNSATFSLSVAAGDTILVQLGNPALVSGTRWGCSATFTATIDGQSIMAGYLGSSSLSASAARYTPVAGNPGIGANATESVFAIPNGTTAFTLSTLYLNASAAPGVGKSLTLTARKGRASPVGGPSLALSGSNTSGSDTTGTVTLVNGNTLDLQITPAGTPTLPANLAWATVVSPGAINPGTAIPWAPSYPDRVGRSHVPDRIEQSFAFQPPIPNGPLFLTQAAIESLQVGLVAPRRLTQLPIEDLEAPVRPPLRLSQLVVEMLIPFACDLSSVPPPAPCPVPNPAADGGPVCTAPVLGGGS